MECGCNSTKSSMIWRVLGRVESGGPLACVTNSRPVSTDSGPGLPCCGEKNKLAPLRERGHPEDAGPASAFSRMQRVHCGRGGREGNRPQRVVSFHQMTCQQSQHSSLDPDCLAQLGDLANVNRILMVPLLIVP